MIKAVLQTFLLAFANLFLIALIIYGVKILFNNTMGIAAGLTVIALCVITTSFYLDIMWAFPTANSIIWLHYDEILSEPIYPMWCSFAYFGAAIIGLIILNFIALKKLTFTENCEL